jgi:hypothetical protein
MTILVANNGAIRLISESEWSLETLQAEYGADMVYRVRQQDAKVRLEGRSRGQSCVFESIGPVLHRSAPTYSVGPPALPTRALSPAGIWQILPEESD